MKILIVPDKFKGTLTAARAAEAIARGWHRARPQDQLDRLPMSDGGDGFGQVLSDLLGAQVQSIRTEDAAHRPCRAKWWWKPETRTTIVESAAVVGLAMLPPGKFHPFQLDTFGLGTVLRAAAARGARRCLVGIGGSATNDAGFGLARAMGWEFLDVSGRPILSWPELHRLRELRPPAWWRKTPAGKRTRLGADAPARRITPEPARWFRELIVAVDVQNPLLGARGASRIYGPQKGLRTTDFVPAERALRQLARVAERSLGRSLADQPGAGAAGGLGFGLLAFLGARLEPGFALIARQSGLARRVSNADLVITGEGALDDQTLMGKGVGQVAACCQKHQVPCIGLAGMVNTRPQSATPFALTRALTELTSLDHAKATPARWLEKLACETARLPFLQRSSGNQD